MSKNEFIIESCPLWPHVALLVRRLRYHGPKSLKAEKRLRHMGYYWYTTSGPVVGGPRILGVTRNYFASSLLVSSTR